MAQVQRTDGSSSYLTGMTRSGKSSLASQLVRDSARVLIWDPQADWASRGFAVIRSIRELGLHLRGMTDGPKRLAFSGTLDALTFEVFCRMAFAWAKIEPAVIVVEELAWVSNAGKAPGSWHTIVTGGLKYGIDLVSITQRPSEADKTTLSQADVIYCFQMERVDDQKYMAKELGVKPDQVAALEPLHYLKKDRRARSLTSGRLQF